MTQFGTFYYTWYSGNPDNWVWGLPAEEATIHQPLLGWYDSEDPAVMGQHFYWMKMAQFQFAVLSSWNMNPSEVDHQTFVGRMFFDRVDRWLRGTVMITYRGNSVDELQSWADYIWDNYVAPRPQAYLKHVGKPLLIIYRGGDPWIPFYDTRFTVRWQAVTNLPETETWWNYNVMGYADHLSPQNAEYMVLIPGADERHLVGKFGREPPAPYHERSLEFFQVGLNRVAEVEPELCVVCSFNEWPETTAIEPSADAWGTEYLDALPKRAVYGNIGLSVLGLAGLYVVLARAT